MLNAEKFQPQIDQLRSALDKAKRVLITAPGTADGDSIGAQLALRRILRGKYPSLDICILNDEPLPDRYRFLPDAGSVHTPESFSKNGYSKNFDVAIIVDGGIDRAGRVRELYEAAPVTVFIDHHAVSVNFPYTIKIVEPLASATTEVIYHISQTPLFKTPVDSEFSQQIYLGLIFDTGFFRHSNTTPEAMELAAKLMRTDFDFTQVGERGMLVRSFASLKLLSDTLASAQLVAGGKIIWSQLKQERLAHFGATDDDREGIIDHLFLTAGIEVAILFYEMPKSCTRVSFRSQGIVDVATFARSLTVRGGGHIKAAGAHLDMPMAQAVDLVLGRLTALLSGEGGSK